MSLIVAENLTKDYQVVATKVSKDYRAGEVVVRALRGVSFEIEPASFVSFVGPSGSGKTTLLNLIGFLDKSTEGKLTVVGTDTPVTISPNGSSVMLGGWPCISKHLNGSARILPERPRPWPLF
jgi:ABC-type sugar transport system ATPase subunit